jgi:hypothetical protein
VRASLFLCAMCAAGMLLAAEPTPPRAGMAPPRSGTTNQFGSGPLTHRSDGTSSRSQQFGSGTLQRDQPGRNSGSGRK